MKKEPFIIQDMAAFLVDTITNILKKEKHWNSEISQVTDKTNGLEKIFTSVTNLCLPLLAADLLVPEVRSRSVGRMAVKWAPPGPSCSTHSVPDGRWPWADGEATKPSSSDSSCCFFRRAFCLARSLARFALARSYKSYHAKHKTWFAACLTAFLHIIIPLWTRYARYGAIRELM